MSFAISDQTSTGRVDIAKCELLSQQVAERNDGRAGAGDEDQMKLQIRTTPDERDDTVLGMNPDIHQRAQASEIVRSIRQAGNRLTVDVGSYEIHRPSHGLREIGAQRLPLCLGQSIEDQADGDWPVVAVKRCAEQNTNCH